ncbi:unnamed protein product [Ceutorhynchus assimilis]|uniref:Uncharacterized protein n=1 Tax=Ceutorhynchus assimilis TaxID=467358 RepID=A0A9N9QMQ2_9CUCU|nr:unnamed protein product [Ceutorhynchus assimilis]
MDIMLIYIVELKVINTLLACYGQTIGSFNEEIKENYRDFHTIPKPEFKKLENGDFMVTGWIKDTLQCKNNQENARKIKEIIPKVVMLMRSFDTYGEIFSTSPKLIFLSLLVNILYFVYQVEEYFTGSNFIYFMLSLLIIWKKTNNVQTKIQTLGLDNYRLYLDMPLRTFLIEETIIKATFLFLYKYCYFNEK